MQAVKHALAALLSVFFMGASEAESRELAPGVHMVPIQSGEVLVLTPTGLPEDAPTQVPAGYWVSLTGYERLQATMSQYHVDRVSAQTRADACMSVAALHHDPSTSLSAPLVVGGIVVIAIMAGVAGYALAKR